MSEVPEPLRVLLADQEHRRLDEIATVIEDLGHSVVARLLDVTAIAEATRRERPDVAIVGVGEESQHALDLISELVREAHCPVIADIDSANDAFLDAAAKRGIFAYVKHGGQREMEHALDIVLRRYAEFSRVHGAFGRRAVIEQAKGILMERHGVSPDNAFEELRGRARSTNATVFDVAEAVVLSQPLLRSREVPDDDSSPKRT